MISFWIVDQDADWYENTDWYPVQNATHGQDSVHEFDMSSLNDVPVDSIMAESLSLIWFPDLIPTPPADLLTAPTAELHSASQPESATSKRELHATDQLPPVSRSPLTTSKPLVPHTGSHAQPRTYLPVASGEESNPNDADDTALLAEIRARRYTARATFRPRQVTSDGTEAHGARNTDNMRSTSRCRLSSINSVEPLGPRKEANGKLTLVHTSRI